MKQAILSDLSPFTKLVLTTIIVLGSFFVFFVIGILIAIIAFQINFFESAYIFADYTNPENMKILKFLQVLQSIGLFLVPPFLLGYLFENNSFKYLSLKIKPKLIPLILSILIMVVGIPLINFLAEVNSRVDLPDFMSGFEDWMRYTENEAQRLSDAFINVNSFSGLLLNVFMIAIIPGIGEELLFRGVIQRLFSEWTKNAHLAVFISAFIFSAMHMQFYGFVPRMLMGVFFGYLFVWSGSIWLPIIVHFVNNLMAIVFAYLVNINIAKKEIETIGSSLDTLIYVIISFVLVSVFIYLLYKKEKSVV